LVVSFIFSTFSTGILDNSIDQVNPELELFSLESRPNPTLAVHL